MRIPPNPQRIVARAGKRLQGPTSRKKVEKLMQLLMQLNLIEEARISFKREEWGIWIMNRKKWATIFDDIITSTSKV